MGTILITGASRGIGLALAKLYAERGDTVLACCRKPENAEALRALASQHAVSVLPLDVTDAASVSALAKRIGSTAIDTLINNAGVGGRPVAEQTAASMNFEAWAHPLDVNTLGPARVMQALLARDHLQAPAATRALLDLDAEHPFESSCPVQRHVLRHRPFASRLRPSPRRRDRRGLCATRLHCRRKGRCQDGLTSRSTRW
jgi:NAD(P)-dependent dehydrogenase (short-subunit alcohol dehydrogenase family)